MNTAPVATQAPPGQHRARENRRDVLLSVAICAAIFVISVAVFRSTLFNFFACDDFSHICWLAEAARRPELLLRNFSDSWLGYPYLKFYRPLISVSLMADYVFWKDDGLGYHITNVLLHAGTAAFLFLALKELVQRVDDQADSIQKICFPAAAAALFAVHPIHPEVVSWIIGRVDSVMALFFMASMWCYMRCQRTLSRTWMVGALVCAAASLCSKEMAVVLAPTLFCAELACAFQWKSPVRSLGKAFKASAPFWALLTIYFVVRALALGTVIGGYGDSVAFTQSLKEQAAQWQHAIGMVLVPFNHDFLAVDHKWVVLWRNASIAAAALALIAAVKNSTARRVAFFFVCWSAVSLVPVYKILAIQDTLQASRLVYLFTLPLCSLMVLGLFTIGDRRMASTLRAVSSIIVIGVLLYSGTALLIRNNTAWVLAGKELAAMRAEGARTFGPLSKEQSVIVLNLPDTIHGAYAAQGIGTGLSNFEGRNLKSVGLSDSFGLFKTMVREQPAKHLLYWWNRDTFKFDRIDVARGATGWAWPSPYNTSGRLSDAWPGPYKSVEADNYAAELPLPAPASMWAVDFVQVPITITDGTACTVGLRVADSTGKHIDFWQADIRNGVRTYNLHNCAELVSYKQPVQLKLLLPQKHHYGIGSPRYLSSAAELPQVAFGPSAYGDPSNVILNDKNHPTISWDVSALSDAQNAVLELSKAGETFANANTAEVIATGAEHQLNGSSGSISLSRAEFSKPGVYQARVRALDANKKTVGYTSDPFNIIVR